MRKRGEKMYEIEHGVMVFSKKVSGEEFFSIGGKKTNFKIKEFASHDGTDEIRIDEELVEKLQIIRSYFGVPVTINSGYRSPSHNHSVGGVENSNHVLGKAADISVRGVSPKSVAEFAKKIGFGGVGTYKDFTHVDTREKTSYWNG